MSKTTLSGRWELRQHSRTPTISGTVAATVPGCVHTDLLKAGKISDPYYRRNELDVLWIDSADWEYRRTVRATKEQCGARVQQLVFEGLDTIAEVFLNGQKVGAADNMFRRWRFDVAGVLRAGENELRVIFRSPVEYGRRQHEKHRAAVRPLESMAQLDDRPSRLTFHPYLRKAQYQFGWDWGPMLATSGIWKDCYLLATDEPWIEYVTTAQTHRRGKVELEVTAHLTAPRRAAGVLRIRVDGRTVAVAGELRKGENRVTGRVTIERPRLWWPAGAGEQPLYRVEVQWETEKQQKKQKKQRPPAMLGASQEEATWTGRVGLRTVELVQEKDAEGRTFKFRINGRDIYCKGANWIPDDVFPTRTTPERLRFLLRSAVEANMNMLRVWGGGVYADEEFLDLCDELGIMLWHDLMFACAAYPDHAAFLRNVEAEVRHQVRRMGNHPAIVLWCGNNENQTAVDSWWANEPKQRRMRKAYDRLTYGVEERVVLEEDRTRPWVPSSPSGCPRKSGYAFGWDKSGDMHDWNVWHGRKEFSYYLTTRPRFASEFGFQSFPSIETLRTVARPEDMNVSSPVMNHHQRNRAGNSLITDHLMRSFRFPADFDDFCYLSQVNQGLALKLAIEHWRRIKPRCMGTTYWQLNDDWPVASWSSIDWRLRWKALHYLAKRFFAPLLASVSDDAAGLRLWATSDLAEAVQGQWTAEAWTYAGRRVWRKSGRFGLAADESRAVAALAKEKILELPGGADKVFLVVELRAGGQRSTNTYSFTPLKAVELRRSRIRATVSKAGEGFAVRLVADAPAFHVELSTRTMGGVFSDNIITLLPGRAVTVRFTPRGETTLAELKKALKVRSVRDTYYPIFTSRPNLLDW